MTRGSLLFIAFIGCAPPSLDELPPPPPPKQSPETDASSSSAACGLPWASAAEHLELSHLVNPIVEPHIGPARPGGNDIPGVAVGVVRGGKQFFFGFGKARTDVPVNVATVFEIGSITKTFIGLALADAVLRGKVGLDDPANTHLPERLRVPSRNGKQITLRNLATHRSGLARMTSNTGIGAALEFVTAKPLSMEDLESWLKTAKLENDPGDVFEYSNIGAALVAFALEAREGKPWATLVQDLITSPLCMMATAPMDGAQVEGKAFGIDALGRVQSTDGLLGNSAYGPAGALRSNMADMLRYAAAQTRAVASPLTSVVDFAQRAQASDIGLFIARSGEGDVPDAGSHSGATFAFISDLEVAPKEGIATVVLTNRYLFDQKTQSAVAVDLNKKLFAAVRK